MKTSELIGAQLDYWVGRACGYEIDEYGYNRTLRDNGGAPSEWHPSTDWSQGGQILDREGIFFEPSNFEADGSVFAYIDDGHEISPGQFGPSRLIAAMRAYVAAKFGETVEVPDA